MLGIHKMKKVQTDSAGIETVTQVSGTIEIRLKTHLKNKNSLSTSLNNGLFLIKYSFLKQIYFHLNFPDFFSIFYLLHSKKALGHLH